MSTYIGKCYFVAPLHDTFGLDRIGWAACGYDTDGQVKIVTDSKSKKSISKIVHELNEELSTT
jgi:hypothetical protein